jgi:hypothetical protein
MHYEIVNCMSDFSFTVQVFLTSESFYSIVLGLDTDNIRRLYHAWGPSAWTCLSLTKYPEKEFSHKLAVECAAARFVVDPGVIKMGFDPIKTPSILLSIRAQNNTEGGRGGYIMDIASDPIRIIISNAAAAAEALKRIEFYLTISTQPSFKASAGLMLERLFSLG